MVGSSVGTFLASFPAKPCSREPQGRLILLIRALGKLMQKREYLILQKKYIILRMWDAEKSQPYGLPAQFFFNPFPSPGMARRSRLRPALPHDAARLSAAYSDRAAWHNVEQ